MKALTKTIKFLFKAMLLIAALLYSNGFEMVIIFSIPMFFIALPAFRFLEEAYEGTK